MLRSWARSLSACPVSVTMQGVLRRKVAKLPGISALAVCSPDYPRTNLLPAAVRRVASTSFSWKWTRIPPQTFLMTVGTDHTLTLCARPVMAPSCATASFCVCPLQFLCARTHTGNEDSRTTVRSGGHTPRVSLEVEVYSKESAKREGFPHKVPTAALTLCVPLSSRTNHL